MTGVLPRVGCRLRGHDDVVSVVGVIADMGVAVLECERCGRRRGVPYAGVPPLTLAQQVALTDVATVDRRALELLMLTAAVDAATAGMLDGEPS